MTSFTYVVEGKTTCFTFQHHTLTTLKNVPLLERFLL